MGFSTVLQVPLIYRVCSGREGLAEERMEPTGGREGLAEEHLAHWRGKGGAG